MSLYVSKLRAPTRGRAARVAYLTADTDRELTLAAVALELTAHQWFPATSTRPARYAITAQQRAAALALGARTTTAPPAAPPAADDQPGLFPTTPQEGER